MPQRQFNQQLFEFLGNAPTPFHATAILADSLRKKGFQRLLEGDLWQTEAGKNYYCIRDDGSLLAFKLAPDASPGTSWRMAVAHTDSPALQIKPLPTSSSNSYVKLGVEVYGGPLLSTWFDRNLGIAGRVSILDKNDTITVCLLDFEKPLVTIPSLAIHLNREANQEPKIDKQNHIHPVLCQGASEDMPFHDILFQQAHKQYPELEIEKILGFDLFCYDTQPPSFLGLNDEFISGSRLDNLVSCFVGAEAFSQDNTVANSLLLCSNHEEIGSSSVAGAHGNFLTSALQRILTNPSTLNQALHHSILLSLDNAHAVHPNFPEKHDQQHLVFLNHGPVIKHNANQRYATTCRSAAVYKSIAEEVGVTPQEFVMKNDMACGSTIGPIAATELGIQTVDIGIPSLAMHSIREMTGATDPFLLGKTLDHFFTRSTLPQVKE